MCRNVLILGICPLIVGGSNDIHRRKRFAINTVSERGYFTRYADINAKPEVQR